MCGIGGIRRFGEEPIKPEQIKQLLVSLERRGNDASGVALGSGDQVVVFKEDEPAWRFVSSKKFNDFLDEYLTAETSIALVHTRLATQGTQRNNENNHPVFRGHTALVHNGQIWDTERQYKELKLEKLAEVDTDIMRAILDEHGFTKEGFKTLRKLSGTAAIAAISDRYPGKLLLARSGSPLVVATMPGYVVFASEKAPIHSAMRPYKKRYGIWGQPGTASMDMTWTPMQGDTLWLLGDLHNVRNSDGEEEETAIELHETFPLSRATYTAPNYDIHRSYRNHSRRYPKRATERTADVFVCRNPKCGKTLVIPERLKDTPLDRLYCRQTLPDGSECGTSIMPSKVAV